MLNSKQRSYLRSIGHVFDPIIQIGKNGIDEAVIAQIDQALEARELIKITILKNSLLEAREACHEVCDVINAEPVQVIGNKFLLYRKSKEKPTIELP